MRALRRDGGFTFTEMIVSAMLFSLVSLVAGGILVGTLSAQESVSAVTTSTTDGQLAASSIDQGIRNSTGFELLPADGGADQMLIAHVAGSGATLSWACRAWYFDSAGDGSIRTTSVASGTHISAPTASQLSTWALLADGVVPLTGSTIFSEAGATLSVEFDSLATGNPPIEIAFATAPLGGVTGDTACF